MRALAAVADLVVTADPTAGARAQDMLAALNTVSGVESVELAAVEKPPPPEQAVSLPDRESQLREIARDIKQRLADDPGLRPSDLAVAVREAVPYLGIARQVFAEFDLPLDPAAGVAVPQTPTGGFVLRLLNLGVDDWRLTSVAEALQSGLIDRQRWGLSRGLVARARSYGRSHDLWSGLGAMRRLADGLGGDDAAGVGLRRAIDEMAPLLDPDRRDEPATFARELDEALFGTSALLRRTVESDQITHEAVSDAIRDELRAVIATDEVLGARAQTFSEFVAAFRRGLERQRVLLREAGGVFLGPMHTLHGLRFTHVSIAGLSQGEFPASRRRTGLLNAGARSQLASAGLALPPEARLSEEELWRVATSRSDGTASLWRSRTDEDGRVRAASIYFAAATADVDDRDPLPTPEEAASRREQAVVLASGWASGEYLRPAIDRWDHIKRVASIEQRRRSWNSAGTADGDLRRAATRLEVPISPWSASRLETYRTCPFQFFSRYVLHLTELDQEQDAAGAATRGTVVHEILEAALEGLAVQGRPLNSSTLTEASASLQRLGPEIWRSAPERHGFGRAALWRIEGPEIIQAIEAMLTREAERNDATGVDRIIGVEVELSGDIAMPSGLPLPFYGVADRLDGGDGLIQVIDYKSGREILRRDVDRGDRLQLQLYSLIAAQQHGADRVVARYAFLDPRNEKWSLDTRDEADRNRIEVARQTVEEVRDRVTAGDFRVFPTPPTCPSYCSFRLMCRVNEFSRWKSWT